MAIGMRFAECLAAAAPLEHGFSLTIPEGWHQGRTAYGGFSAALAHTAALRIGGDGLPPLRSASISFIGPLFGHVEVRARVLRRGRNATWVAAEVTRDGEVGLTASFVFMGPVASGLHLDDRPAPADCLPFADAPPVPFSQHSPAFMREHFEARFALPRREDRRPEQSWWVRLREPGGIDAMTGLLLAADALPPGVLSLLDRRTPASSMIWQVNLLTPAPQTRDGWWLLRSDGDYAEAGCSSQRMAIWNADGTPVMAGMQSVAIFG